ncbi:MAG: hypothetical protein IJP86_02555 [Synergistaceae bacterium]|nr:hypothetical protein [Synergistaceae bacterium]
MYSRRFTALIAAAVTVFSSFSPVYADMREEKLDQREKMLTERAVILSGQSVSLDDKEQELSRRAAELEALSKVIQGRNIEVSVREVELDEIKAGLNRDAALLASQNRELERDRRQFDSYRAEVERRAENAERLAREASQKIKSAEEKGVLLAQRERELTEREEGVRREIARVETAKADLLRLDSLSKDVAARIAGLDSQIKNLEAAQSIYNKQKKELEEDMLKFAQEKAGVEALKAERDRAVSEAERLRAEAEDFSRQISGYAELSDKQKATIDRLSADLAAKNEELRVAKKPNPPAGTEAVSVLMVGVKGNDSVTSPLAGNGIINWSDGSVRAIGQGYPPENINDSRMEILARRAAVVDLQRNLLETVKGVQVDSRTSISQLALKYDVVETKVSGLISGVEVISEKWDAEKKIYTVAGQIRNTQLSGVMSEVARHVISLKKPREPKKTGTYTGLIIDVRHLGVSQQKFFHLVDEKGSSVYGIEYADKSIQAKDGLFVYFRRVVLTADEKARVGDNPLVIKAQRFAGNGEDIVIPNSEADKIRRNKTDFRRECKVIIVMS